MNYGAEPADQVVRYSLEGTEVALRLSGRAAVTFAKFVAAVLQDQKKTHGKTRLVRLLREGKPLKFFSVEKERIFANNFDQLQFTELNTTTEYRKTDR